MEEKWPEVVGERKRWYRPKGYKYANVEVIVKHPSLVSVKLIAK